MTKDRTALTAVGTVVTGLCCVTPVLALGLGALGLATWLGWGDFVLFPALAVFLGITVSAWSRLRCRSGPGACDTGAGRPFPALVRAQATLRVTEVSATRGHPGRARRGAEARGGYPEMGWRRPPLRRPPRRVVPLGLVVAIALAGAGPASAGQTRYLPFEMFRAWQRLVPEAAEIRLCGLTRAGHALWAQGQLRLPLSSGTVAVGALTPDHELWAVLLEAGDEPASCDHVLVLTRSGPTWQRLLWQRLQLDPGVVPTGVLWDGSRAAVLVDTGERKRLTAPATLRWEAGRVVHATPGFVIEVRLIRHVLWWRADNQRLEYERLAVPLEVPDASEERP